MTDRWMDGRMHESKHIYTGMVLGSYRRSKFNRCKIDSFRSVIWFRSAINYPSP